MLVEPQKGKVIVMRPHTEGGTRFWTMEESNPCYKVAKSLAELVRVLVFCGRQNLWAIKFGYLAEEISKQCVEGAAWLLLNAYSKIQEERNDLKTKWLTKRQTGFKNLENSQFQRAQEAGPFVSLASRCLEFIPSTPPHSQLLDFINMCMNPESNCAVQLISFTQ